MTLTLTDFLLARIAEDEAANDWTVTAEVERCRADGMPDLTEQEVRDYWADQAWWKRRLAECEAKRRIVGRCSSVDYAMPSTHLAHGILAELALPYTDHPDFRDEWRP